MASIERALKESRQRVQDRKWEELGKLGITRPKNEEERLKRLKDAHGGT